MTGMIQGRAWTPPPDILEAPFQDAIAELARTMGWRVAHFRNSRTGSGGHSTAVKYDGKGFPDLVLVHPKPADDYPAIVFAEIKTKRGKLNPDQDVWGRCLQKACSASIDRDGVQGVVSRVWRPRDWAEIVDTLTFGRGQ